MTNIPNIVKLAAITVLCLPLVASSDKPPTYKGLVCMGWTMPEAQAISEGYSEGESLVVNTELTAREKRDLYYVRREMEAAAHKETAIESTILANHHLLFPLSEGSEWMRIGPCGDTPMIRTDEYHITQFVPSNPRYPGKDAWLMTGYYHTDPAKCRSYFAEMRKKAVKAKYGHDAEEHYMP